MEAYAQEAHFGNYTPSAFGWSAADPERNSSMLTPFEFGGASFGPMNKNVVGVFTALLTELVPHIEGGLLNGQCGCYNPGSVTVGGDRSFHTYATAIDVNWNHNPMYARAHPTGKYTLPMITGQIAKKYGCEWGGNWSYPQDWMHIECHLTPEEARAVTEEDAMQPSDVWGFTAENIHLVDPKTKKPVEATMAQWLTNTRRYAQDAAQDTAELRKEVRELRSTLAQILQAVEK